jgi:predicted phage terminase large subunit-like protein
MAERLMNEIRPQEGPQEVFLSTSADVAFYGGAAGGGKTFSLLLEVLRFKDVANFGSVIFRREGPQITNEGGLWDESEKLFPFFQGEARQHTHEWFFGESPNRSKVKFSHMQHENDRFNWQGAQIPFIGFDELTHFTEKQFFYLLGRNRSTCGIRPYVRATCNPDSKSWVKRFISWYIDKEGWMIPERSGVIRWFTRFEGSVVWGDTREELLEMYGADCDPISFTFVKSSVFDNKILLAKDPGYLSKLKGLPKVERMALLDGNWNASESIGDYFQKQWFEVVRAAPKMLKTVRFWDRAATRPNPSNPDPDWTVGVKMGIGEDERIYVLDVVRFRDGPHRVRETIKNTASQDGVRTEVALAKDPGQAGVVEAQDLISYLRGFVAFAIAESGDKETRAKPFSAQAEAGNVKILEGDWNEEYLDELENFPHGGKKDQVDASSGAFGCLVGDRAGEFTESMARYKPDPNRNLKW